MRTWYKSTKTASPLSRRTYILGSSWLLWNLLLCKETIYFRTPGFKTPNRPNLHTHFPSSHHLEERWRNFRSQRVVKLDIRIILGFARPSLQGPYIDGEYHLRPSSKNFYALTGAFATSVFHLNWPCPSFSSSVSFMWTTNARCWRRYSRKNLH
jgi:hypothetical protein